LDQTPGPPSSATLWERLFMECDKQGHVLWMNQRARARLGPVDSLFEALPAPHLPEASQLLKAAPGRRRFLSSLQCAGRPKRIPVQLVRLVALEDRVVLSAEVRARASDTLPRQHDGLRVLLTLQANATRNYFRLLQAHESLASRNRASRSTGAVVSEALEIERTRIARELHSGAGQTLAGIKVNLELIAARMTDTPEPVRNGLDRIGALADQALSEIRSVSQRLHPPDWQRLDLPRAIEWLWVTTGIPEKFHATLELHPLESDLPDPVRFTVYRVAQEGLANVLRHASATELKLALGQRDDHISLTLEDNGGGFDAHELLHGALTPAMRGIGLRAMRDEVHALGGRFELISNSAGTKLEITLPITENR
jgi:two-component system NarL family sensor kinase